MPPRDLSRRKRGALAVALSVAGSDSGGGAGIQADLLTFGAMGVFGTTAITCLTAQSPDRVTAVQALPPEFVREQMETVCRFFPVAAAKTGMLFDRRIIAAVAAFFREHRGIRLVVDPVMVSTSGAMLLQPAAVAALTSHLLPLASIVTPNLDEAAVLLGHRPTGRQELSRAARTLARRYAVPVLLKGGHLPGRELCDVLAHPSGRVREFHGRRIDDVDTHGSGCTLSAAIAAGLARGERLETAVERAREYLRRGMRRPLTAGSRRFIAHLRPSRPPGPA